MESLANNQSAGGIEFIHASPRRVSSFTNTMEGHNQSANSSFTDSEGYSLDKQSFETEE